MSFGSDPIVVASFARTPLGSFRGCFSDLSAAELGAISIEAALKKSGLNKQTITNVIMGCVLPAGQGQAPARQAAIKAGLLQSTPCTTMNKMCGSGMEALILACHEISSTEDAVVIAGGMESMTNAPYLIDKTIAKNLLSETSINPSVLKGHFQDHLFLDGLQDAYDTGKLMGVFAESTAKKYNFSRSMQDDYAIESLLRAQKAIENNWFSDEITPVFLQKNQKEIVITKDEQPQKANAEKIPTLKPVFEENGTVTAANASSISDGASALVLLKLSTAKKYGIKPIAKIVNHSRFAHHPSWFTTAPIGAINSLLKKIHWPLNQVDLFEINEAFAVVALAAITELGLQRNTVNIHGGACALGHPIGASGARIVCTLLSSLKQYDKQYGIASLCIGGGEATALAIERL